MNHFKGDQAYFIRWMMYYDCRLRIPSIKALELNLEVLITEDGEIIGWRFDHPEDMKHLIKGGGEWEYVNDYL